VSPLRMPGDPAESPLREQRRDTPRAEAGRMQVGDVSERDDDSTAPVGASNLTHPLPL
jgi:hypothetical protein